MTYEEFLARKALTVEPVGFVPDTLTAPLFPFQQDIVRLACQLGRFCIWADCVAVKHLRAAETLAHQSSLLAMADEMPA